MNAMRWLSDALMMLSRFAKTKKSQLRSGVSERREEYVANMRKT